MGKYPLYDMERQAPCVAQVCEGCGVDLKRTAVVIGLACGATLPLRDDDPEGPAGLDGRMLGFLNLSYHEVFPDVVCGDRDAFRSIAIARDVVGGQFDLGVCSIECFRQFLHRLLEELTAQIVQARQERSAAKAKEGSL